MEPEKQEKESETKPCIPAAGIDAGRVNLGIAAIKLYGLTELVDEQGVVTKTIPKVEITGAGRWDIQSAIIYRPTEDMLDMDRYVPSPPSIKSSKMKDWATHIGQMVPRTGWLFEASPSLLNNEEKILPALFIENQSDFVQRDKPAGPDGKKPLDFKKAQMSQIAGYVGDAIFTTDVAKFEDQYKRERLGCMSKYGLCCDGTRERVENKELCVEKILELLEELGTENSLKWLNWFQLMEKKGEQIHDICDAISLAVQGALKKYEKHCRVEARAIEQKLRAELKQKREHIKSIPKAKSLRKTAAPKEPKVAGKATKKPATQRAKKNTKSTKKTTLNTDDEAMGFTDDNLPQEDDCAVLVPPKKPRKKARKKAESSESDEDSDGAKKKAGKKGAKKSGDKKKSEKKAKDKKRKKSESSGDDVEILTDPVKKKGALRVEPVYPILLADESLSY